MGNNLLHVSSYIPGQLSKELHSYNHHQRLRKLKKLLNTNINAYPYLYIYIYMYKQTNHPKQASKQRTSKVQPLVAVMIPIVFSPPAKCTQKKPMNDISGDRNNKIFTHKNYSEAMPMLKHIEASKLPKIVSLLCFTEVSCTNMRKHFLLKDLFGISERRITINMIEVHTRI